MKNRMRGERRILTKKRKAIHAEKVEKKLKCQQSAEENCWAILAEKKKSLLKSPLVHLSPGIQRESDLDYGSDSSSDGGDVVPKKLLLELEARYTRLKKSMVVLKKREGEFSVASEEMQLLKKKLCEVKEENKILKKLNYELQEKVINRFSSASPGAPQETAGGQMLKNNQHDVEDGNVTLGKVISLPKEKWDLVMRNTKDSIFIKDLAVAVWGSEALKGRSVVGIPCRRLMSKGAVSKPPLTSAKLNDIRATFEDWLEKQGVEGAELMARSKKYKSYISDKIMYLNRKDRSLNEREGNNLEVTDLQD
ncbi:uncharacterized protein LOC124172394 [Ischnura elegans]|uniref:uncharacterized protein LOC124172394 n=1 Tax=Ischnura elegans TaxID=197161 RepID=UPI001ED885C4|nr:uncharacterized protein LOC124172394 [Ischnura elegans]